MNDPQAVRREWLFSGRVQGVGFRFTTREIARGFGVAGWVQNLPDGRVRMVAEGPAAEVDRFGAAVEEHFAGFVQAVESLRSPAAGLSGFVIKH